MAINPNKLVVDVEQLKKEKKIYAVTGTANNYVLTDNSLTLVNEMHLFVKFNLANTSDIVYLNVNSLGNKRVYRGGTNGIYAGTIQNGSIWELIYTNDSFVLVSGVNRASTSIYGLTILNDSLASTSTTSALTAAQGKVLKDQIGDLTELSTTEKTNLVGAINEVSKGVGGTIVGYAHEGNSMFKMSTVVSGTKAGITLSYDESDDTININGTCTADNTVFSFNGFDVTAGKIYTSLVEVVSGEYVEIGTGTAQMQQQTSDFKNSINLQFTQQPFMRYVRTFDTNYSLASCVFRFNSGNSFDNYKIRAYTFETETNLKPIEQLKDKDNKEFYPTSHATGTYLSDGKTLQEAIDNGDLGGDGIQGDGTIKKIILKSYDEYKVLENAGKLDPDTEYHIPGVFVTSGGTGGSGSGDSGHIILNSNGNPMAQRTNLQFKGATVTDSSAATIVSTISSAESTSAPGSTVKVHQIRDVMVVKLFLLHWQQQHLWGMEQQ